MNSVSIAARRMLCALGLSLAGLAAPQPSHAATTTASTPAGTPTTEAGTQTDPLDSPRSEDMKKVIFDGQPVVFDDRNTVTGPAVAEDALNVPITADASAVPGVEEMIVFADFNPILKVLRFEPGSARASLGFRIKGRDTPSCRARSRSG